MIAKFGRSRWLLVAAATLLLASVVLAQGGIMRGSGRRGFDISQDRRGVPTWEIDERYRGDLFTFVRVRYDSYGRGGGWATDYPDADLNLSLRLQQLTTFKVNPEPIVLDLTDDRLFDYPFIYMAEPGGLFFSEPEIESLRKYLLNGGFLMADDFWGDSEYENIRMQLARVFPDRSPQDLPLSHEIFHCVYDLKEKPQMPAIEWAVRFKDVEVRTWEPARDGSDTTQVNYRALFDDDGRMMVLLCHNTDLGDGWEREGEDPYYFEEFAVKRAYPMGINIITYAMTH
ncbi:MAG: DUF4159 domain-containing protein [Planctomycetaceae bacterium]|nr:MAG: DUF4159 domain-containing protein [Planctomycetaceae bacterium]